MLNNISLQGRLATDPELRETGSGVKLASFTLAVNRPYQKDKDSQTDFFDIVAWRGTGEFVARNFRKGDMAVVNGRLQTDVYKDKEGKNRKSYRIVANEVYFGGKKDKPTADVAPIDFASRVPSQPMEVADVDDDLPF